MKRRFLYGSNIKIYLTHTVMQTRDIIKDTSIEYCEDQLKITEHLKYAFGMIELIKRIFNLSLYEGTNTISCSLFSITYF